MFGRLLIDIHLIFDICFEWLSIVFNDSPIRFFDVPGEGTLYTYLLKGELQQLQPFYVSCKSAPDRKQKGELQQLQPLQINVV